MHTHSNNTTKIAAIMIYIIKECMMSSCTLGAKHKPSRTQALSSQHLSLVTNAGVRRPGYEANRSLAHKS